MKKVIFVTLAAALVLAPFAAQAATISGGESYTLRNGEKVVDNLYAGGGTVVMTGEVTKDALVAGGNVRLDGPVGGDVFAVGGTVDVGGKVAGDVRAGGGNVFISGTIGGELVVAGGTVQILPGAVIAGDVLVAGGELTVDGTIGGKLTVAGGKVNLAGTVSGEAVVKGERVSIAESANLKGGLAYKAPAEAMIASGAKIFGGPKFERSDTATAAKDRRAGFVAFLTAWWLLKILMIILVGFVMLALFRGSMAKAVAHSLDHYGIEMFRGFAGLILIPVAAVLLAITVIGLPFTIIGFLSYGLLLILSSPYAAIVLGGAVARYGFKKTGEGLVGWQWVVSGAIVFALLGLLPVIGWLIGFLAFLTAFGSLLTFVKNAWVAGR